jgi:hypothetical protein
MQCVARCRRLAVRREGREGRHSARPAVRREGREGAGAAVGMGLERGNCGRPCSGVDRREESAKRGPAWPSHRPNHPSTPPVCQPTCNRQPTVNEPLCSFAPDLDLDVVASPASSASPSAASQPATPLPTTSSSTSTASSTSFAATAARQPGGWQLAYDTPPPSAAAGGGLAPATDGTSAPSPSTDGSSGSPAALPPWILQVRLRSLQHSFIRLLACLPARLSWFRTFFVLKLGPPHTGSPSIKHSCGWPARGPHHPPQQSPKAQSKQNQSKAQSRLPPSSPSPSAGRPPQPYEPLTLVIRFNTSLRLVPSPAAAQRSAARPRAAPNAWPAGRTRNLGHRSRPG